MCVYIYNEQTAAARVLRARGVERGSVVATCVAEGHYAIVTQLAILLAGTRECYKYHEREAGRHGAAGQGRGRVNGGGRERERERSILTLLGAGGRRSLCTR
jgi:hypothetical protein